MCYDVVNCWLSYCAEKKTKKSSKSKSKKEPEENKDNELATGAASVKPVTDKENKPLVKHLVEEPKTNDTPVPQPKIETEVKKLETHVLPLTPPPAAKKEKHPRVLKGPKPEAEEKDKEHKRSDARPEIPKPVETAAQRKAPERPLQQTRQKPKEKVYQSNSYNHMAELLYYSYHVIIIILFFFSDSNKTTTKGIIDPSISMIDFDITCSIYRFQLLLRLPR